MVKLAFDCNVTLPFGGMTTLRLPKVAVVPNKVVVPKSVPLFQSVITPMPEGVPVPVSPIETLVNVTGEPLGLLTTN